MKILEVHEKAMEYSQQAKISLNDGDLDTAMSLYKQAADLEVEVVDYYFKKEGSNRSKSVFVRSAAFLCLKAGEYERAYPLIMEGLRISDEFPSIKEELLEAMEVYLGKRNQVQTLESKTEFNYERLLANNAIEYTISSADPKFAKKLTVADAQDFFKNYDASIRAFAKAEFRSEGIEGELTNRQLKNEIVPLITAVANGSLKVSIAMDYLAREQSSDFRHFKETLGKKFHSTVLTPEYTEERIESYNERYDPEERKGIFEPIFKIRSSRSKYNLSYSSRDTLRKIDIKPIKEVKKTRLITYEKEAEVRNEIEVFLMRMQPDGKFLKKNVVGRLGSTTAYSNTMLKDSIVLPTNGEILLTEDLVIDLNWTADEDFTIFNEVLGFEANGETLEEAIALLSHQIEEDIISLNHTPEESYSAEERKRMKFYKKLINDVAVIK